jgi:NAD(P)-dependent dehydrogenase (short-subunit alcohol dehydrogenase family)
MKKMDGKSAIVTGAAMGNGLGIARVLAKHGAKTVLADISEQVFQAADDFLKKETNPNNPEDVIQGIAGGVPLGRLEKLKKSVNLLPFLHLMNQAIFLEPKSLSTGVALFQKYLLESKFY